MQPIGVASPEWIRLDCKTPVQLYLSSEKSSSVGYDFVGEENTVILFLFL